MSAFHHITLVFLEFPKCATTSNNSQAVASSSILEAAWVNSQDHVGEAHFVQKQRWDSGRWDFINSPFHVYHIQQICIIMQAIHVIQESALLQLISEQIGACS